MSTDQFSKGIIEDLRKANKTLAEAGKAKDAELTALRSGGPVVSKEVADNLQAEIDTLRQELVEAKEVVDGKPKPGKEIFIPVTPGNVVSRHDGLPNEFSYVERLSFAQHSGYDSSALQTWAMDSIKRAFMENRCGDTETAPCTNLPPFDPALALEVSVRIVTP